MKVSTLMILSLGTLVAVGCAGEGKKVEETVQVKESISQKKEEGSPSETYYNLTGTDFAEPSPENTYAAAPQASDATFSDHTSAAQPEPGTTDLAANGNEAAEPQESSEESPATGKAEIKTLDPAVGTSRSFAECSLGRDARSIEVVDKNGGGCGVNYKKPGFHRQVAWANYDMAYCDEASARIQGNLTTAGFSCSGNTPELASEESGSVQP